MCAQFLARQTDAVGKCRDAVHIKNEGRPSLARPFKKVLQLDEFIRFLYNRWMLSVTSVGGFRFSHCTRWCMTYAILWWRYETTQFELFPFVVSMDPDAIRRRIWSWTNQEEYMNYIHNQTFEGLLNCYLQALADRSQLTLRTTTSWDSLPTSLRAARWAEVDSHAPCSFWNLINTCRVSVFSLGVLNGGNVYVLQYFEWGQG